MVMMIAPLKKKDDIKIFILYLLHNLNKPLEFEDINAIVMQDGVVGGIDFAECFAELLDSGNIKEIHEENKIFYLITERGRHIAENLQGEILGYIRTRSLKSALRFISFKERGSEIKTSFSIRADGKYDLCCQIIDERQLSLEIKLVADNVNQLELMRHTFDDRPEVVYRGVLALLTGEIDYLLDD